MHIKKSRAKVALSAGLCLLLIMTVVSAYPIVFNFHVQDVYAAQPPFGDFNGDGYGDLAISVPLENVGSVSDAGAVNIIYGSSAGLSAAVTGGTGRVDQIFSQNSADIADTAETSDQYGWSIAVGDFNNDLFSDLAVGIPGEDVGSIVDAGAVSVIYGTSGGLSATAPIVDQFWHQDSADIIGAAEAFDQFGWSLAAGDFNDDGHDDLAIGVKSEDIGSVVDAGSVNIMYGSPSGLSASATIADQGWDQNTAGIENVAEEDDFFGWFVITGNFNDDLFADLAIAVPFEDIGSPIIEDAGALNVIYGSSSGLRATAAGDSTGRTDQFWTQDSSGIKGAAEMQDSFAYSLAVGDFNNDGNSDLAVGVPFEDVGTSGDAGAVNVIYGSSTGLAGTTTSPDDQIWDQNTSDVEDSVGVFNRYGWFLAGGDFNDDGNSDLAIGIPFEPVNSKGDSGAVNVIYGSSGGLSATTFPDQFWHQDVTNVEGALENFDFFGYTLSTGDFDNDGNDELVIGVPFEDVGAIADAGGANVLYGSVASGLSATATRPDQIWDQGSSGIEDFPESSDNFSGYLGLG